MTSRRADYAKYQNPLADGILFSHWRDMPTAGWTDRWPDFQPWEFASRDKGQAYYHPRTFDAIQRARNFIGAALFINSAHRSVLHNLAVRGSPRSAHLFIALDVSTRGHDRLSLFRALLKAGFRSFGFYQNFIHVDMRPGRRWFGDQLARKLWEPLLAQHTADQRALAA